MKVHDVKQGSKEWLTLRAGIPTSSEFSKILTPTGKPSRSQPGYMHALIAERLIGRPIVEHVTFAMERGSRMEKEAVDFYEFERDVDTQEVGIVTNDEGTVGASPDRLVGDDGLLEIKCPSEAVHVSYLLLKPVDKAYYPQIMGQLWITGRKWLEIMSYHPEMPPAIVRVERDEKYIKSLAGAVMNFSEHLEDTYRKLCEDIRPTETRTLDPLELQREDVEAA